MAHAAGAGHAVVCSGIRYEPHAIAVCDDPDEILPVVIERQSGVPRPGGFRQFAADEPACRWHVNRLFKFPQQPFDRRQITPKRGRGESGLGTTIKKMPPW